MTDEWTVERAGSTYGPVSWDQVTTWARDGHVGPTDLLRRAGDPTVYGAGDIPGLIPNRLMTAATAATPTSGATASAAAGVPWVAALVVVSVATLAIVLGVRAIGSRDDSPAVPVVPAAVTTAPPPASDRPQDDPQTTSATDPSGMPADPSAYLGPWTGFYWPEPSGVGDDPPFWKYFYSHRIGFDITEVTGDSGPELRVTGDAVLPPITQFRPFEGVVVRIMGDGSLSFAIAWTHGPSEGESTVLHFTGQRTGTQITGTIFGERLSDGSTVTGTWQVNIRDG